VSEVRAKTSDVSQTQERNQQTWPRRETIPLAKNPRTKLDYVITGNLELKNIQIGASGPRTLRLDMRYVPDQDVITGISDLAGYCQHLGQVAWPTLADLGTAIMADFNDVLMPRWLEIRLDLAPEGSIYLQERQPKWANPTLLSRIQAWQ
jgi:hypothetical protein